MKQIEVEIEGVGQGLLMNSCKNMLNEEEIKQSKKTYDPKEEAEKVAYRNKKGNLIVPILAIRACVLNASSAYRAGRQSMKSILAGYTEFGPEEPELLDSKGKPMKKYEIDRRAVVVQRARIIRSRPLVREWKLRFEITYNEEILGGPSNLDKIRKIIEESGNRIGLLDHRPQKYGMNGKFKVTKFLPK